MWSPALSVTVARAFVMQTAEVPGVPELWELVS